MKREGAHKVREPRRPPTPAHPSLAIVHASELLTLRGPRGPRIREAMSDLGIVEDGAVYIEGSRIVDVGPSAEVLRRHPRAGRTIDASGKIVLPGFVDAHTHAVFAGSREHELEWKAQGLTYTEIANRGGGILHTVRATREADEATLAGLASDRLATMIAHGTTTAEVKSGYGLRTADELKILQAASSAGRASGVTVVPTFLGAHAVPPEFEGRADAYADLVASESIDAVVSSRAASFCDVFLEPGYFDPPQARRVLQKAATVGLGLKIHADELSDSGGASLAAELRATSADHLLHVSAEGIDALATAGVVGVLLPATSLASRLPYADGRRLVDAGVPVALGTDFNPNCWCESMQLAIALACHHNGLLPAQAITAATINSAYAVGRGDTTGSLEAGKAADVLVCDAPAHQHLGYRLGGNLVGTVVRGGRIIETRALTK